MPPPNVVDRLSSRKKRNRDVLSPRVFLIGIVFAASMLSALSVYLANQLDGQSPPVTSSTTAVKGDAKAVISSSDGDDNVRPVICNELLNDSTIWDPSKLHCTLFLSRHLLQPASHNTRNNFCHTTSYYLMFIKIKVRIKMK